MVDYAHTPQAVAVALRALRPRTSGPLVVVLGAGGDRDPGKRGAMGAAAAQEADVVVVTDDNPRSEDPAAIRAAVLAGAREAAAAQERQDGHRRSRSRTAPRRSRWRSSTRGPRRAARCSWPARGTRPGQEVAGTVHPFDDREVLARLLAGAGTAGGAR